MSQQNKEKDLKFQTFFTKFGSYGETDRQNMHILSYIPANAFVYVSIRRLSDRFTTSRFIAFTGKLTHLTKPTELIRLQKCSMYRRPRAAL